MKTTRRTLFGLVAGFLAFPFWKQRRPTLNEMNQHLWDKHWENVANTPPLFYHPRDEKVVREIMGPIPPRGI